MDHRQCGRVTPGPWQPLGGLGQGRTYLPVPRSFCPWTVFRATLPKSNLIFAVSELLLFYESVSDFDGDGARDDDGDEDGDDKSRGC